MSIETIGSFDAKTHLSKLLERVAQGESFLITRRGVPVARLLPAVAAAPVPGVTQILAAARQLRHEVQASEKDIRDWIDEGRA